MDNIRGSLFMILAMGLFAVEDMLIKQMSTQISTGQIFIVLGIGGTLAFLGLAYLQKSPVWTPVMWHPIVLARTLAEIVGSVGFVTALSLIPISSASAIIQVVPLAVTLGAAVFLKETVGWRRWLAIFIGLFGVLLIIQPGTDAFQPASLFAVQGVIGLAARDVLTRLAPAEATANQFSVSAFLAFIPVGLGMMLFGGDSYISPNTANTARLGIAIVIGVLAYLAIITATRTGDVATVAPFRYSRILFALVIGYLVFDERPDVWMIAGTAIVIGSGLFAFWREHMAARRTPSISDQAPL